MATNRAAGRTTDQAPVASAPNAATAIPASRPPAMIGWVGYVLIIAVIVALDYATKAWAVQALLPRHTPREVIGDFFRFTLTYNPGAAFGISIGPASRWLFAALSVVIVVVLVRSTRDLVASSRFAAIGVPTVIGGAIGNLIDRLRLEAGVVDFIDIGIGSTRFWTFNIADTAVTIGAACLILALWREGPEPEPESDKHA